ncbi:ATP-binding protein [uncultured Methanomethylovorans sp.]|uniref:sensor histidine kinase n=1 Tax=uncultured Methanomethylovorans sp. TaxID=183759 RepID=UPI002AA724E3|nr:ATP-binding protein [uncultured Methanomethylovorans sp.]
MTSWSKEFYAMVLIFMLSAILPYIGINANTTLKIELVLIFCVCVFVIYISVNHSFNISKIVDSAIPESPVSQAPDISSHSSRYELPEITSLLSPLSGTEDGIIHILSLIGELTDCTRCSVYELQGTLNIAKRRYFWTKSGADGEKDVFHNYKMKMFPLIFSSIKNKKSVYIRDITSVKEATPDIKLLQAQVKISFIAIPIVDDGDVFGFIAIEDSQKTVSLEEEPSDLIFLSELLRLAIVQKKFIDEISLFKNLINRSNDYIIVIDRNTSKLLDANETLCAQAGYSKAEFMSMEPDILMDAVGNFWAGAFFEACGSSYLDVDSSFKTKDGKKIPVEINVTFIAHGDSEYVLAVARNIIERKERELVLQKIRDRVELALNGADLGIWDWDVATDELVFNTRWAEMLGYQAASLPPNFKSITGMIHELERDKVISVFRGIKQSLPFFEEEFRVTTRNNEIKWLLVRGKATEFDNEGKASRLTGTAMDITQRKMSEDHLKQYADKLQRSNEMKELFTDILRHDLLNPAGAIKGYTELLLEIENNERKKTMLERIQKSDNKLIDMIDTAAKFAKLESQDELEFSIMDLGDLLRNVTESLRTMLESKKIEVFMRFSGVHSSSVNPIVEEVFANFLTNAVKYSSENTSISIYIFDEGGMWKVAVSDQGEGISDADKPYVFDRFKRVTKKGVKGTGLGLAIVKRIAELHHGDVGVEDNPEGKGSRFWILLNKA